MKRRLASALVALFFLVGASWPQGWYPKFGAPVAPLGAPPPLIPAAMTDGDSADAESIPRIEGIRISRAKAKFGIVLDLSNRTDFWYWTAIDQSEVVIEFPSIQAFSGTALNTGVEDLIGVIKFEVYQSGRGGRVVVPLKRPGIVESILLLPDRKSGRYRLVVEVARNVVVRPPSNGQGMAWGGGNEIDRVSLIRARKKGVRLAVSPPPEKPVVPARTEKPTMAPIVPSAVIKASPVQQVEPPAEVEQIAAQPDDQTAAVTKPSKTPSIPSSFTHAQRQASAQALSMLLGELAKSHKRILAANADLEAARRRAAATRGAWYPTLDITAHYGYEIQRKDEGVDDTHMPTREIDFKITQLMWDFGSADSAVEQADLAIMQAEITRDATLQAVLLEGYSAHLNYAKARAILTFARQSERNIKRQAEVEDIRVRRGSGFSSDVLQAKVQLAGAEARRVQAGGLLIQSGNRYNAVFAAFPDEREIYANLDLADELLPAEMADAVKISLVENLQIKAIKIASRIARSATRGVEARGYYPALNLIAEAKYKEDVAGSVGFKGEQILRLELTFPFNLGGAARHTVEASKQAYLSSESRLDEARAQITERTRVAWRQLGTAREVAAFLLNQADIAAEFLELARRERELGKRSLIDLLAGETALINAAADAAAAEIDVSIAGFTLLGVMGRLSAAAQFSAAAE